MGKLSPTVDIPPPWTSTRPHHTVASTAATMGCLRVPVISQGPRVSPGNRVTQVLGSTLCGNTLTAAAICSAESRNQLAIMYKAQTLHLWPYRPRAHGVGCRPAPCLQTPAAAPGAPSGRGGSPGGRACCAPGARVCRRRMAASAGGPQRHSYACVRSWSHSMHSTAAGSRPQASGRMAVKHCSGERVSAGTDAVSGSADDCQLTRVGHSGPTI